MKKLSTDPSGIQGSTWKRNTRDRAGRVVLIKIVQVKPSTVIAAMVSGLSNWPAGNERLMRKSTLTACWTKQ